MAARRRELSQRRKAVGFTQELLAAHLGVERSTVIRWEAGDSEPLPSIRPTLARALQVSIEQLAELLANSEIADPTRGLSADPEVTIQAPLPEIPPQMHPDEAVEAHVRPQVAETIEALRRALRSAGVSAEDLAAMLLVGGSSPGPDRPDPPRTEAPNLPAHMLRRSKRWLAAGSFALALPALWLSAPFATSHGVARSQVAAGSQQHAVPVVAIPSPNPGATHGNSAPSADTPPEPSTAPVGGLAQPSINTATAPHTTRVTSKNRTAIPSVATPRLPLPATEAWRVATAEAGRHW